MRQWLLVGALAIASLATSAAMAVGKTTFPRIGGVNYGDPFDYDNPTYQAALAKLDVMVLKTYPGRSFNPEIQAIKRANPNALVFFYMDVNERDTRTTIGSAWDAYLSKINTMKWWLYPSGTSGTPVQSWFGPTFNAINLAPYTRRDSAGLNAIEWMTKFYFEEYFKPNSNADGLFVDNVFVMPNIDGDWNVDGTLDKRTDPNAGKYYRQGMAAYFKKARALMPGKIQLGNIGAIGEESAVYPEYVGVIEGGMIEGLIGKSWSPEQFRGWATMMAKYRKVMKNVTGARIVIFNQWGNPTDYQSMRYGLASCLMDDGYYNFTNTSRGYSGVNWFDEYNANLGAAESAPPTAAWKNGVYRRDFENGIALVNPKGNGARTITLESDFVTLKGTQVPSVNTGKTVRTITLKDRDGIILMRPSSGTRPMAPADLTAN